MRTDIPLRETNIAGAASRERIVRGSVQDQKEWLVRSPQCEALARRHIAHVGAAEVEHPYRVVRCDLGGTFMMACCAGRGQLWLDGRWHAFHEGQACLAPPHAVHAYRAVPGQRWEFVWVRYQEPADRRPIITASSPLLAAFEGRALRAAVVGLYHEAQGPAVAAFLDEWVELIELYVRRFTQPWREDDRLRLLWEAVAADLSADWSVEKMAQFAGLSSQQLRRLCQRSLGRKPGMQLAWLRIRKAVTLLARRPDKIESVAQEVGYRSAFTFSSTFKRLTGRRPSEYRRP